MRKLFVNACFLDQILLTNAFSEKKWHVHSKYKNSFNIQDEGKEQLVVISTTDYPFMPNGIYIESVYFSTLLSTVEIGDSVRWQEDCLHFSKNHLLLNYGELYSSTMEITETLKSSNLQHFNDYAASLDKETGAQVSLADFLIEENPFAKALQLLCLEDESKKQSAVAFLLGRGKGLTPSGDDMLVGHLAARILLNEKDRILEKRILTELSKEPAVTTDISKHYLLCALSCRFSAPVIEFIENLTTMSSIEQLQKAVDNIIKVGHTSGLDLLAGFMATIEFLNNN
ncbi:DUF2877 domain-containing protein [Enterococcus sp. 5H]|uniref:DUF2877 domain-containing protein n=1 Tax=Enterococcus sp. 5H TaxID=1229490 RepID=UPI002301FE97|nr:DUF2877 domain-containing protein [Enterococcus sp. 5H]